jgi:very-short-patch-repair endonuclease
MPNSPRALLSSLFEYVGEQLKSVEPPAYYLSGHAGFKREPLDLVGLPSVELDLKSDDGHVWLRVARLEAEGAPKPADGQQGLFLISEDPFGAPPSLNPGAVLQKTLSIAVEKAFETYRDRWVTWSECEKPRRQTIALYGELFSLKHQIEGGETANPTELVWGIGVASWRMTHDGEEFPLHYPILTQSVEISLDENSMMLEVRPRLVDAKLELDPFIECQVIGAADIERTGREFIGRQKERLITPFDASSYVDILKLVATNLDSKGTYLEVLNSRAAVPAGGKQLIVTDSWALFSRPRVNNYLIEDLKRLQSTIEGGCEIPEGPLALVSNPADAPIVHESINFRGLSSRGDTTAGKKPVELHFPLPYNAEQVTIMQRLEHSPGVTVQGPPGTGKTHTIANIICHYVATGRRVLVTSRGEQALKVLQSMIPEQVRPLSVALLTNDQEGVRQFQASIEAIQHQVSQLNTEETRAEIRLLESSIDRAHAELSAIDRRVDDIAMPQLEEIEVNETPLRAQKLADLVVSGAEQHSWFDDVLSLDLSCSPPLSDAEAATLRAARRKLGADLVYANATVLSADELPGPAVIAELHDALSQIRKVDNMIESGRLLRLKNSTPELIEAARRLRGAIEIAAEEVRQLETSSAPWVMPLREKLGSPRFASERIAFESVLNDATHLIRARAEFLMRPVELPQAPAISAPVREAVAKAAKTGKPFGAFALGLSDAKRYVEAIRISGLSPASADEWVHVNRFLDLRTQVHSFENRWNGIADALAVPRLEGGIANLKRLEAICSLAKIAHKVATVHDASFPRRAERIFDEEPASGSFGSSARLQDMQDQLGAHIDRAALTMDSITLFALREKLAGKDGPVMIRLREFIERTLGSETAEQSHVLAQYADITSELRRISTLALTLSIIRDYARRLEARGAVKLGVRVRTCCVGQDGEDTTFPPTWRDAWTWARVRNYLDQIDSRDEFVSLNARRTALEESLSRFYRDLVSKTAWLATKSKATPRVLQALAGYGAAIRRIGQGTGPNAARYRRDARDAMFDAVAAVPCWIMSHAKISESMPAQIGAFDLVIVDEASQSDLWALPAIVRGKRILVVGDDKQVSPSAGFINAQTITDLRLRFLTEQPYGVEMTPEKSLYELAARVFAAQQVMLREHFRCVPAIIAYSNRTFYGNGILPLRIPKASERIDPPLVDLFVEGGRRDRHDRNEFEARAIADEIEAILGNEALANRTLGVVSLLGMDQAKYIDSVVRKRCAATELLKRRFLCGDASTFQGSERDIMFLSLVVDEEQCKAISGAMFNQRFNVAASRARDRMYLVRSIRLDQLSNKDLRLTLLNYFEKPAVNNALESVSLLHLCESGFERDVFASLTSLGYRVMPQVKTGAHRIDMVVEGRGDKRLAIECDGDDFHGPDRWRHDIDRQRILERAGWSFWRCFASTWSLRKADVFGELIERLTAMGIEPLGALDGTPNLVEKRTWTQPQPSAVLPIPAAPVPSAKRKVG